MANLKVNNHHILKLKLNKDEYWDFFVNNESPCNGGDSSNCLLSYIDMSICDDDGWIYGDKNYTWENAVSVEHTLYNISYTGVDNGIFQYRKDRITNKDFFELFQKNNFKIEENDNRLKLHAVSGNSLQYDYPIHCNGDSVKFNGGFYQGFFKTKCDTYQVLPTSFEDGEVYHVEMRLKKCDFEAESNKTLNDKYPENKGIFFYIGTRSENKWIYQYDKDDIDGLEECYQLGMDDFVEGGEIDIETYGIGDCILKPNPDFDGYDPFELGDYTNYNYYSEELYEQDECDWNDMYDYIEIPSSISAKTIDESQRHTTLTWCCGEVSSNDEYSLVPFFTGCNCPIRYKKVKNKNKDIDPNPLKPCTEFGEDYISDFEDLGDLDSCQEYLEDDLDISNFEYETDNGLKLSEANQYYFYTDNKFLMFDRTKSGKTVKNWVEGTQYMYYGRNSNFKGNLFILMNRTKTGYTVHNIDDVINKDANYYDPYKDIYNNALAFRITDNGEIGYRMLTIDCEKEGRDKTSIIEGYSAEGIIPECEWVTVNIKINFVGGNKMKLMFYVDGKLKYITRELPRIDLRELNDLYEKQEGVPYNISIGGGTQGLAETVQYNYMLNPTRVYPIEKNFAGTFIGYISSFKLYNCLIEQRIIEENAKKR